MNTSESDNNTINLVQNSLLFRIPARKVLVGLFFKEKKHLKRLTKKHFTEYCKDPNILNKIQEYVWLDSSAEGSDASFSFRLDEIPYLALWYYEYQVYLILKEHLRITRQSFTGAYQYWVEAGSGHTKNYLVFEKYKLYFDLREEPKTLALSIAYDGLSKVLLKHSEELVNQHQMDTTLLYSVIYEKECQPFNRIPDEIRLQPKKVYPILRKEIADFLDLSWESRREPYKLHTDFQCIQKFYTQLMSLEEIRTLFPENLNWTPIEPSQIHKLPYPTKKLRFGKGHISDDIYTAIGDSGPFSLPLARHFKTFIIYTKEAFSAKEILEKHLTGHTGYSSLQAYSRVPLVYRPELNLEIQQQEQIEEEIEKYLRSFQKETDVQYFAYYISPYPKYGYTGKQHQHYYYIKELLLKRKIVSQTLVSSGIRKNINLWIPNLAVSMIAKLGGVPWKLTRESEKELIVGFGAFKIPLKKQAFVGSSFCFDNEGHFQEFDCWQKVYEWSFIGSLHTAILKYKEKNKGISRIVIHYYKELNKKEFRQVEELLDRFELDIPVIVVRINSTFRSKELIVDISHPFHLPLNATYYRLQYHDYLLYINEREKAEQRKVKQAGYPLKVSLQSNRAGLVDDPVLVQQLMQQLYDFSLLHWRSIKQPRLPVTIAYPQYLAHIFPYFKAEILQDIGKTSLWFL